MSSIQMQIQDYKMKNYDLVIANSLEELIETTNEAYACGYLPVGGMLYIENKFIQTIIKLNTKKQMNTFFAELAASMADRQNVSLKITKVGDDLTVMATTNKKSFTATGTPEEIDGGLLVEIKKIPVTGFTVTPVTDAAEEEEEESDDDDKKEVKKDPKKKEVKSTAPKKEVKKAVGKIDADTKGNIEKAVAKFEEERVGDPTINKHPNATAAIAKAHEEGAKLTEAKKEASADKTKNENAFKSFMHEGKRLFADTKLGSERYALALAEFEKAKAINPGDADAIMEAAKAEKWIKMVAEL